MLNKVFYPDDDILNSFEIHPTFNTIFQSTNITDSTVNNVSKYTMNYSSIYPSILDSTIYENTNVIFLGNGIEFLPDTTTTVDIVLSDDYLKLCCDTLCTTNNKWKLKELDLNIRGTINGQYMNKAIFLFTQENPITDNIIYDYVLNTQTGTTIYNKQKLDLITKKEMVGYVNDAFMPDIVFKCIDSTGGITYNKFNLIDLGYTQNTGLITSTFYDTDTTESSILSEDMLTIGTTLPIIFESGVFKLLLSNLRDTNEEVHILFRIKNWSSSNSIYIYENDLYFKYYKGCIFYFTLSLQNETELVNNSQWFLNRGMYVSYNSPSLATLYNIEVGNVIFNINDMELFMPDPDMDKSLLETDNYIDTNNTQSYIPLEWFDSTNQYNIFTITIKDLSNDTVIDLMQDLKVSLMKQMTTSSPYTPTYDPSTETKVLITDIEYKYASERTDFTNSMLNCDALLVKQFNKMKTNINAVHLADITNVMEEIDNDVHVNIFLRKCSTLQALLYVQFKKDTNYNHFKRFLTADFVSVVLNNIAFSITSMNHATSTLKMEILKPPANYTHKYVDSTGTVTYLYTIDDKEIISVNGVYNKTTIENSYTDTYKDTTSYYIPSDVVLITNNKR